MENANASLSASNSKKKSHVKIVTIISAIIVVIATISALLAFGILPIHKAFSDDPKRILKLSNSVVMISCYYNGEITSTGSGFIAIDNNTIVTNCHVIDCADKITFSTEQDFTYAVKKVICYDEKTDIALLWTDEEINADALTLGSSTEVLKGEKVTAIGSPLGFKNSVSTGILSGRIHDDISGTDSLHFTASISSGSSGGALFNESGEIIGITYATYENGQNINLAVPVECINKLYSVKGTPLTVEEYLSKTNPGFVAYNQSTKVKFADLISSPQLYNKKLISFSAYVVDRDEINIPNPSRWETEFGYDTILRVAPTMIDFDSYSMLSKNFEDYPVIFCYAFPTTDDNNRAVEYITTNQFAKVGELVEICGYFSYKPSNQDEPPSDKSNAFINLEYYKIISDF